MSKMTIIKPFQDFIKPLPGNKGLEIDENTPFEAYEEGVRFYGNIITDGLWALGDLFIFGERKYGEEWAQALEPLKYTEKTIKNASWVCNTFPYSRRHKALTFNHHAVVAALEPSQAESVLSEAEEKSLTVKETTDLKKSKFPSTRKTKVKKDKTDKPKKAKGVLMSLSEGIEAIDLVISFMEQQDKSTASADFHEKVGERLNNLRRIVRRLGFFGGNK